MDGAKKMKKGQIARAHRISRLTKVRETARCLHNILVRGVTSPSLIAPRAARVALLCLDTWRKAVSPLRGAKMRALDNSPLRSAATEFQSEQPGPKRARARVPGAGPPAARLRFDYVGTTFA